MSRSLILSNGELAVALNRHGMVLDVYYPHVGQENHVRGNYVHRVGVFVDGVMSWIGDSWEVRVSSEPDALISSIVADHHGLGIQITFTDAVSNEHTTFVRHLDIKNVSDREREIKLYFGHEFELHKMHGSDTAYFDPFANTIVHYKGRRVFEIGATLDGVPFTDYATGRTHFHGREGSYRDADDGILSKNSIEHGPADSVIGLYATYAPMSSHVCEYWMCAAESVEEAKELNVRIQEATIPKILQTTRSFWRSWVKKLKPGETDLRDEELGLFTRSLMFVRAHADVDGGIIASLDSDMLQYGLDTYSYVWPRDGAYVALALDHAGESHIPKRFFEFCQRTITPEGYFMHKYWPDGALGSSWHPWIVNGEPQLPIQEDETAIVIIALKHHIVQMQDFKFLEKVYESLVRRAADFLVKYRDPETKLPLASYDLWERKRGTSTYTSACVYGALLAAADLSEMLEKGDERRYAKAAKEIREGILTHLWDDKRGLFYNMIDVSNPGTPDPTIDISSVYGIFLFQVLPYDDARLERAFETTVRVLSEGVEVGGIARFENDDYYRVPGRSQGNPWFLTTLWYADYLLARSATKKDREDVCNILAWTARYALPSGALSEQLDPYTGAQICAGPLTWAHATYVNTLLNYVDSEQIKSKRQK